MSKIRIHHLKSITWNNVFIWEFSEIENMVNIPKKLYRYYTEIIRPETYSTQEAILIYSSY